MYSFNFSENSIRHYKDHSDSNNYTYWWRRIVKEDIFLDNKFNSTFFENSWVLHLEWNNRFYLVCLSQTKQNDLYFFLYPSSLSSAIEALEEIIFEDAPSSSFKTSTRLDLSVEFFIYFFDAFILAIASREVLSPVFSESLWWFVEAVIEIPPLKLDFLFVGFGV